MSKNKKKGLSNNKSTPNLDELIKNIVDEPYLNDSNADFYTSAYVSSKRGKTVKDDSDLFIPYVDPYQTRQQKERDDTITLLLKSYEDFYKKKTNENSKYKSVIFWGAFVWICALILLFALAIVLCAIGRIGGIEVVSICLSALSLVIGILKIIVTYLFPKNEEKYVTDIVKIIQNNDLKHKKASMRKKDDSEE